MNHPTVCIRKQMMIDVGGYPQLPLLEDYYLWAKLMLHGARFHNLNQALYLFRFDDSTLDRRGGLDNFKNEVWLRRWMFKAGLTNRANLVMAIALQAILRFAPRVLRRWLWRNSRTQSIEQLNLPV